MLRGDLDVGHDVRPRQVDATGTIAHLHLIARLQIVLQAVLDVSPDRLTIGYAPQSQMVDLALLFAELARAAPTKASRVKRGNMLTSGETA